MAKNKIIFTCLFWFSVCNAYFAYPKYVADNCINDIAETQVGVTEQGGNNKGLQVEDYLKAVGLKSGNPWCAAFVRWVFDICGIKSNITGWSPTSYNKNDVIYTDGKFYNTVYKNQDVLIMSLSYDKFLKTRFKGIGHTGIINKINTYSVVTIEGNTNQDSARDSRTGDGVLIKKRPLNKKLNITRWIKY